MKKTPAPHRTRLSYPSLLPIPAEPHDVSNLFPEDLSDHMPIKNNRRVLSNYLCACRFSLEIDMVYTHGTGCYCLFECV